MAAVLDDAELVRMAQRGDAPNLGVLLERHRAPLHALALGILGSGSEAQDAVQDAFLIAYGAEVRAAAEPVFGGDFSEAAMAEFMRLVAPAYVHDPKKIGQVLETWGRSAFAREVAAHYFRNLAALYDVRNHLGEILVPTLMVVGENDWLIPPSASRVIAEGVPGAELVIIPNARHFSFIEGSGTYADAARRFLSAPLPV